MNKLLETWKKLPTGGKVAIGAGVAALIVYVWKSGSSSNATDQSTLTTPTTDQTPTGTGDGGGDSSGTDSGGSTWGGSSGGTDSGSAGGGSSGLGGIGSVVSVAPVTQPVVTVTKPTTVYPGSSSPPTSTTPKTPVGSLMNGNPIIVNPVATQSPAPADANHIVGNMTQAVSQANSNVTTQVVGYQPTNKWSNINGTYFVADKNGNIVKTYTGQDALYKAINDAKKIGGQSLEYALPGQ